MFIRDAFNKDLCEKIVAYWKKEGYAVTTDVIPGPVWRDGFPISSIVSDLGPTGLPKTKLTLNKF